MFWKEGGFNDLGLMPQLVKSQKKYENSCKRRSAYTSHNQDISQHFTLNHTKQKVTLSQLTATK